jgi:hypothetical protein
MSNQEGHLEVGHFYPFGLGSLWGNAQALLLLIFMMVKIAHVCVLSERIMHFLLLVC